MIEKLVSEMLMAYSIVPLLGLLHWWRTRVEFFIDHRASNKIAQLNNLPIPVIEELLGSIEELQFSPNWSWNQATIKYECKVKTSKKLHSAPVINTIRFLPSFTFQSLINEVLKSLLRKSALVFFDIPTYSDTMDEHVKHLKLLLPILMQLDLKVNQKKCISGQASLEYQVILSHTRCDNCSWWIRGSMIVTFPKVIKELRGFCWSYRILQEIHQRVW